MIETLGLIGIILILGVAASFMQIPSSNERVRCCKTTKPYKDIKR